VNVRKAVSDWGIPTVVTSHCRYLFPVPASNGCNAQGSRAAIEMKAVRVSWGGGGGGGGGQAGYFAGIGKPGGAVHIFE